MTALAACETVALAQPQLPPSARPARAHLRLVPPVGSETQATGRVWVTRRGRLVRAAVLALVVGVSLSWSVAVLQARARGTSLGSGTGVERVVEVQAGQTLSHIAVAELPQLPVREGVARIQLANELNTDQVRAGQQLRIPVG